MEKNISEKDLKEQVTEFLESNSKGAVATKIILATVALGGLVFVGAAVPGIIKAVEQVRRLNDREKDGGSGNGTLLKKSSVSSTLYRFKRNGYIEIRKEEDGKTKIFLTEKGRRHVYDFTYRVSIKKPLVWDRKWRVVIFDVPVTKSRERTLLRLKLQELEFQQLQKSVWVFPYKCEDEVLFFARQLRIVKHVEILTVQKLVHAQELRKRFNM